MIGIIVWSDTAIKRAVIWCEDQRDLAYFLSPEEGREPFSFQKGDLVEFDTHYEDRMRIAVDLRLVERASCSGLADALRQSPSDAQHDSKARRLAEQTSCYRGAKVTPLSVPDQSQVDDTMLQDSSVLQERTVLQGPFPKGSKQQGRLQAGQRQDGRDQSELDQSGRAPSGWGQGDPRKAPHSGLRAESGEKTGATILPFPELMRA